MNKAGNYAEYKTYYYDNYNGTSGDATLNDNGHTPNGRHDKERAGKKTFNDYGLKKSGKMYRQNITTLNSYIGFHFREPAKVQMVIRSILSYTSVIDSDAANDKYTFTNLPKYDAEGNLYKYKVKETFNVSGRGIY